VVVTVALLENEFDLEQMNKQLNAVNHFIVDVSTQKASL
jgi:hypothetical protein